MTRGRGKIVGAVLWVLVSACGSRSGDLNPNLQHLYDVGPLGSGGGSLGGGGSGGRQPHTGGAAGQGGGHAGAGGSTGGHGAAGHGGIGGSGGIAGSGGIVVGGIGGVAGGPSCSSPSCNFCGDCWSLCLCEGGDSLSCSAQCFPSTGGIGGACSGGCPSGFLPGCCLNGDACGYLGDPLSSEVPGISGCQAPNQPGNPDSTCPTLSGLDGAFIAAGCCRPDHTCGRDLSTYGLGCVGAPDGIEQVCGFAGAGGSFTGGSGGVGAFGGTGGVIGSGGSAGADMCAAEANSVCEKCACTSCFGDITACFADSGCPAILSCANQTGCSGIDCLQPSTCETIIDQFGGISGSSVGLALPLFSCLQQAACPCGFAGSSSQ